jgi:hypothetical protein
MAKTSKAASFRVRSAESASRVTSSSKALKSANAAAAWARSEKAKSHS